MDRAATRGLYDARFEHDSCGFGLIANLDGRASRWVVETALTSLARLAHRGAVAADGRTGDGCGVLIQRPEPFLRTLAREAGIALGPAFAAGTVFLSPEDATAAIERATLERELARVEVRVAGWRVVPIDADVCGATARANAPRIEQLFVAPSAAMDQQGFLRALFVARRRAELALASHPAFYVVSLSPHTLGYKAMVLPAALPRFFPDLARADLAASAVVFHQRFSTNTMPQWRLAHPFRVIAHNGEINTIHCNRSWARARAATWKPPHIDLAELDPIVAQDGSDSQSLDNMVELLCVGGMEIVQALRVLIPPTSHALEQLDPDLAAFYEYYALHSEP